MEIVIGDYKSKHDSYLRQLERLSEEREDCGFLHSGCILWIQSYLQENFDFTLKAAIAPVLDAVPSVFPQDLPQQVEEKGTIKMTSAQIKFLKSLNKGLILPIQPIDIVWIILSAQEYEKWASQVGAIE